MKVYSNAGLHKWREINDSFPLNKAAFLIGSMLSLSYVEEVDVKGKLLCLVDLQDLRRHGATNAREQCDYLVDLGFAYYMEERTTRVNKRTGEEELCYARRCNTVSKRNPPRIAIGEALSSLRKVIYFFEMKAKDTMPVDFIAASDGEVKVLSEEFKNKLNNYMSNYDVVCVRLRSPNRPIEVENLMTDIHRNAQLQKMDAKDLIMYIECIRCIILGELSIASPETITMKTRSMASKVLGRMQNNIQMLEIVVAFVENLHTLGDGCQEASIYTLSFHFNKIKAILYGKRTATRKTEDFENDRL